MGNWARFFKVGEIFKGRTDKVWRWATPQKGPKRIHGVISKILDIFLRPKT